MSTNGFILMDFIPLISDSAELKKIFNWENKKSFVLDNKRIGQILVLDHNKEFNIEMGYTSKDKTSNSEEKRINIFNDNEKIIFNFNCKTGGQEINFKSKIDKGDLVVLQKLFEVI